MPDERLSTGVKELDAMLSGGVFKGVNILVRGGTGTGKTTLALQYLVQGARNGEKSMYLTFEESRQQIVKFGSKFFKDLGPLVDQGMIQIVDFSPHINPPQKTRIIDGQQVEIPEKDILDSVAYIEDRILDIRGQTITRVVIDGLQTFATTFYDLSGKDDTDELRRTLSRILVALKKEGITTYVLSEEVDEGQDKYSFANFVVDGIFVLKVNEALDIRTMKITKMRGIRHTLKPMSIKFVEDEGIAIADQQKHAQ